MSGTGGPEPRRERPSLLLSDVDGTLVTDGKVLTQASRQAVDRLRAAGIRFAVTSSRPPAGLRALVAALAVDTPVAAFNGGMIVAPGDGPNVLARHLLPAEVGRRVVEQLARRGVEAWVFTAERWLLRRPDGPYVGHEEHTVGFAPTVVDDFEPHLDGVGKVVGVSEDFGLLERCESELRQELGASASVVRSQSYYLDATHPRANKGTAVDFLAGHFGIPRSKIATIGDGLNDVAMFARSGLSIAMGNASGAVKQAADRVTRATNDEDGFAEAVRRYVLGDDGT